MTHTSSALPRKERNPIIHILEYSHCALWILYDHEGFFLSWMSIFALHEGDACIRNMGFSGSILSMVSVNVFIVSIFIGCSNHSKNRGHSFSKPQVRICFESKISCTHVCICLLSFLVAGILRLRHSSRSIEFPRSLLLGVHFFIGMISGHLQCIICSIISIFLFQVFM